MEIEIKERKEKEAAGKGREQRMKYKSVRERRSIAVAANFPNFANKLPETKILKRIVKVLTCSRPLQFIRASLPPFLADCVYLFSIPEKTFFSTTTCHSFRVLRFPFAYHRQRRVLFSCFFSTTFSQENFKNGTRIKINRNTKYL